jgi:protein SCO1/2
MLFRLKMFAFVSVIGWCSSMICGHAQPRAAVPAERTYEARGVVQKLDADGRTVVIQHDDIPNYMPAMTMPFEVRNTNELRGLQTGDAVTFRLVVSSGDAWVEHIAKTYPTNLAQTSPGMTFRLVRDVDPLGIGDELPVYHFTNELGQAVNTSEFKGQVFAFTFFFTRCPYPLFCPLMSNNFDAAQKKLLGLTNAPAQWHLLSISFDTGHDTPAELKDYASRYSPDPKHWSFVTGDLMEITAIGDQFGEYFGSDGSGGVTHNLRTVVIDPEGRVRKIFTDNKWTSDDLVAEMLKAAAKP